MLRTRAPVAIGSVATPMLPLDLHVLSLSLAFILSQDQTLHCTFLFFSRKCPPLASDRPGPIECNIRFPIDGSILYSKSYLVCKLHFVVPQCQCPLAFFLPESECKGTAFFPTDQTFSRLFFRNFSPCCVCGGYVPIPPPQNSRKQVFSYIIPHTKHPNRSTERHIFRTK